MESLEQAFTVSYRYPVTFTRSVFDPQNDVLRSVVCRSEPSDNRVLVVIDSEVLRLNPTLLAYIGRYGNVHRDAFEFVAAPFIMRGGEACKQGSVEAERIQAQIEGHRLCRHSFIVAIGGGAVLDVAGYAAATSHRGVRLIRMPTTVLSQNDAGVGVKNGVNAFGRKNFIGTFAPPFAVINDFDFLASLPPRELRSGIAEAVKVGLVRDRSFFETLYDQRHALAIFETRAMEQMITRCAKLHLQHISHSADPFEFGSARPLDFGHWTAHRLEELTQGELRHGEAVAIGIALDSLYSKELGYLDDLELQRILALLDDLGFDLYHRTLGWFDVETALAQFREHLGGQLSIPLLNGIGCTIEAHHIDPAVVQRCIGILAQRAAPQSQALTADGSASLCAAFSRPAHVPEADAQSGE